MIPSPDVMISPSEKVDTVGAVFSTDNLNNKDDTGVEEMTTIMESVLEVPVKNISKEYVITRAQRLNKEMTNMDPRW